MIASLGDTGAETLEPVQCDVAVVGAGIAGTVLACELARRGVRVVVLESGGPVQAEDTHPLNRVVQRGQLYRGAEHGRFRCLGGTSTRWGGAMLPFLEHDLAAGTTPGRAAPWPVSLDELMAYLPRIEALFRLPPGPYEMPQPGGQGAEATFLPRAAKWPSFARRNVARIFEADLRSPGGPRVWLDATVTRIALSDSGRAHGIEARNPAGSRVTVIPTLAVIAAGAIESTRLLLKLDGDYDQRLFSSYGIIGRHFHDHLAAPVATIRVRDRARLNAFVGFRFEATGMRSARFELAGAVRTRCSLPGAFAHITFSAPDRNGFDALRGIYRSLQRRGPPEASDLALLARNSGWLTRAAWTRFVRRRLLPPDEATFEVQLVTEQVPAASNRVSLSSQEQDGLGVPLAEIDWRVSDQDIEHCLAIRSLFAEFWSRSALAQLGDLELHDPARLAESLAEGGGIYHPGGTLPMASSPCGGVLDAQLRAFAVPNLRVISTAAFPSGGAANPTMMLLLFALRAADDIYREIAAGRRE
jgi:choline dehydrogenase-like flavoprotein